MKKTIARLLLPLLLLGLTACGQAAPAAPEEQTAAQTAEAQPASETQKTEAPPESDATPAPDFELPDQNGKTFRLTDYKGKIVLLNFWATWCPHCVEEMPALQKLFEEQSAKDEPELILLGVAAPGYGKELDAEGIGSFLRENGITYPTLLDEGGSLFETYAVTAYPTTFVIGRDGAIFGYIPGALSEEMLQKVVEQVLESA